ncbi:sugar ABC transporter substrate-binding protein [Ruminococcus sp. OA3]|nr:sugar ABC transporter substrate-binding protein [Ruminococcus sp. OA3]MCH1981508.1 sugar ABC transporter substrate-binding protein [Ruminococcus sp. OA3]
MRKKLLAILCTAVITAMVITGCGGGSSDKQAAAPAGDTAASKEESQDGSTGEQQPESNGSYKIGMVVNYAGQDPYQTSYYDTMVAYAKEKGVDLQILDPKGDATTQANQVQDLINMKCDSIIIWPVNSEAAVASARAANKAGIPCMSANTRIAESGDEFIKCHVGPSCIEESKQTAQEMVKQIGEDAKIVEIAGPAGYSAALERSQGLEEGIEGTNIQILDSQTGEGNREKCQQIAENYLIKYGKGELDAIYVYDDNGAYGAWNAVEAAGRQDDVKVYAGASGSFGTLDYVKDGKIAATVMQSPYFDAETALDMAIRLADGEEPENFDNSIETPLATADTADSLKGTMEAW